MLGEGVGEKTGRNTTNMKNPYFCKVNALSRWVNRSFSVMP